MKEEARRYGDFKPVIDEPLILEELLVKTESFYYKFIIHRK